MKHALPAPTVWPAALALGATLAALGVMTSPFVLVAGVLVVVWALVSWISLLLDEAGHR
jgi:hypothetical protein